MNAEEFMEDLAKRLRAAKDLDEDVLDLMVKRALAPNREKNVALVLADQIEKIAMGRAKKGKS